MFDEIMRMRLKIRQLYLARKGRVFRGLCVAFAKAKLMDFLNGYDTPYCMHPDNLCLMNTLYL